MQNDKLCKALSYTLSELHARGFSALSFDWKELVFVNSGGSHTPVLTAHMIEQSACPLHKPDSAGKRPAASGSMMYLQNSVTDIKAEVWCLRTSLCSVSAFRLQGGQHGLNMFVICCVGAPKAVRSMGRLQGKHNSPLPRCSRSLCCAPKWACQAYAQCLISQQACKVTCVTRRESVQKGEIPAEHPRGVKCAKTVRSSGPLDTLPTPAPSSLNLDSSTAPPDMATNLTHDLAHFPPQVPPPPGASNGIPRMPIMPPPQGGLVPGVPMPHSGQALSTLAEAASLMNHTPHPITHMEVPGVAVPDPPAVEPALPVPQVMEPQRLAPPPATSGKQEEMATIRHFMDSSLDCPKAYEDVKRLLQAGNHTEAARVAQEALDAAAADQEAVTLPDLDTDAGLVPAPPPP